MTRRETPSRTKRELRKLRRRRDTGDGDDEEITVELVGVAPVEDPESPGDLPGDDRSSYEAYRVDLGSGGVETVEGPDPDDLPECATADCQNPVIPPDVGLSESEECEKCSGMPQRDWREVVE